MEFNLMFLSNFHLHLNRMTSQIQTLEKNEKTQKKKKQGDIFSTAQNVGNSTGIPQRETHAVKTGPK